MGKEVKRNKTQSRPRPIFDTWPNSHQKGIVTCYATATMDACSSTPFPPVPALSGHTFSFFPPPRITLVVSLLLVAVPGRPPAPTTLCYVFAETIPHAVITPQYRAVSFLFVCPQN